MGDKNTTEADSSFLVEVNEDNFEEKLDELEEPTRNDIDKDEFLIAKERLKEMPEYIEICFGTGEGWDRYDIAEAMIRGQGAAKFYVELTMAGIRAYKELDEVDLNE